MSKAAVDQFTKSSLVDLAPKIIRVNAINPSLIRPAQVQNSGYPQEMAGEEMAGESW